MLRLASCVRPAGESPVRVSAGAPGSRPQSRGEIPAAERGVESLIGAKASWEGASARAATAASSHLQPGSRAAHVTVKAHVRLSSIPDWAWRVPAGYGELHARTVWHGTRETRLSSLVSKDRSYKPKVKSGGGQRESEGAVVVTIGVQKNAPGAKGPHFGRACKRGTRRGLGGKTVPTYPGGPQPVAAAGSEMAMLATRAAAVQQPGSGLWAAAKRSSRTGADILLVCRGDSPVAVSVACDRGGRVAASGRPSVSRVRENRTHGSKGESGNGLA